MKKKQNILICPLEWGLGHAARMIPLAVKLRDLNNNIFIGTGKGHQELFRNEIPGLNYIDFPGFRPYYSRYLPQYIALLFNLPVLIYHVITEHFRLKKIIRDNAIDMVISDNRFGLWNRKIKSVYVTHMILIPFPKMFFYFEFIGIFLHREIIRKFTYCFIPDLPGELNISGRLSHGVKLPGNAIYIGILSRFTDLKSTAEENPVISAHNTVILSGPEPQRSILKQKLTNILKDKVPVSVILAGSPDKAMNMVKSDNLIFFNHLPGTEMKELITGSEGIIARSGYTTVMELMSLKCSALLIPTPGQTEQEYLARYLREKGWFTTEKQKDLNEGIILPDKDPAWSDEIIVHSKILLEKALTRLSEE